MRAHPHIPIAIGSAELRPRALRGLAALSLCAGLLFFPLASTAQADGLGGSPSPLTESYAPEEPAQDPIRLVIESPSSGGQVESEMHMAEVRGTAIGSGDQPSAYDVMIAIDVSRSTEHASGADVDGDGNVGEDPSMGLYAPGEFPEGTKSTDPEDTVLHAEIAAARALIASLDPRRNRVGILTFSGEADPKTWRRKSPNQRDANLEIELTQDFSRLDGALQAILDRGPSGATNFAAGIRLATQELSGFSGSKSAPRPDAKKVILFLTDGVPSFPAGRSDRSDPGDVEAAVNAARVAQSAGIRINSFALGPDALTKPLAATEIARVTLGTFTPVLEPGAIVAALQSVSFANVEDVGVMNLTTREDAPDVRLSPDGSFVAFVPVKEGRNRVLVNALASDGSEANVELEFDFSVKQNMDDRMRELELARLRRINDELIRHLEAERVKRERRLKRMERQLELEAIKE
ncbi:MAG: VWA domain-containing protein [Myxococcota bacterium]|nr:VWA domain-containing protein [Myxococcota bacterium]